MRGTPSWRTTSACLPMARRTWQQARAEPTASPSGRACEVNTNRSCSPILRSTSSKASLCLLSTRVLTQFAAFLRPVQQFFDPSLSLLGTVETEKQFGCSPDAQALHQL